MNFSKPFWIRLYLFIEAMNSSLIANRLKIIFAWFPLVTFLNFTIYRIFKLSWWTFQPGCPTPSHACTQPHRHFIHIYLTWILNTNLNKLKQNKNYLWHWLKINVKLFNSIILFTENLCHQFFVIEINPLTQSVRIRTFFYRF
jgi:hypothetical protein